MQITGIGTIATVYLDTSRHTDKAEYIISIDGIAAACQLEIQSFQILINDQYIFFGTYLFRYALLKVIAFSTAVDNIVARIIFPSLLFLVFVYNLVDIQFFIGYGLIEVGHYLETEALDEAHHGSFIILYLPVLELAFQSFLSEGVLACSHFLQCLAYFGACLGGGYDVQPVLLGRLRIRCHYLHLVTAMQHLLQLYILAVHFCTDTFAAQFAMDVERKIEHGGAFGKFEQITFGGKYKYLVFVQIQFELVHRFQSVAVRAL